MANKLSMISKHKVWGNRVKVVKTGDFDILSIGEDLPDDKIEMYLGEGRLLWVLEGVDGSVCWYGSKKTTGFVYDVNEGTYSWNIAVNPFCDQNTWEKNVDKFYDLMWYDEKAISEMNSWCYDALMVRGKNGRTFDVKKVVEEKMTWLRSQAGDDRNSGQRKQCIARFLGVNLKRASANWVKWNKKQ